MLEVHNCNAVSIFVIFELFQMNNEGYKVKSDVPCGDANIPLCFRVGPWELF